MVAPLHLDFCISPQSSWSCFFWALVLLPGTLALRSPTGELIEKWTASSICISKRYTQAQRKRKGTTHLRKYVSIRVKRPDARVSRTPTICNLPAIPMLPTARWKYVPARVEKAMTREMRAMKRERMRRRCPESIHLFPQRR
jgi:hypothetical protein